MELGLPPKETQSSCGNKIVPQETRTSLKPSHRSKTEIMISQIKVWSRLLNYAYFLPFHQFFPPILPLFKPKVHDSTPKSGLNTGPLSSFWYAKLHLHYSHSSCCLLCLESSIYTLAYFCYSGLNPNISLPGKHSYTQKIIARPTFMILFYHPV